MKRLLSCTLSAILTLVIGLSWYFNFDEGMVFGGFIVSTLSILTLLISPFLVYCISEYDEGKLSSVKVERVFKSMHDRPLWLRAYNLVTASIQIILLVTTGFPILAGVYLISNAVSGKLMSSCGRRYGDYLSKK